MYSIVIYAIAIAIDKVGDKVGATRRGYAEGCGNTCQAVKLTLWCLSTLQALTASSTTGALQHPHAAPCTPASLHSRAEDSGVVPV